MTEDIFTNNVERLEKIYSILIKGDTNPQQETEMRVELIDVLSNLEASLISERVHNQEFITQLEQLRDILLSWDPYGHWFRQQKNLVDLVYEVQINAKNVVFHKDTDETSEASHIKSELESLKSELSDLRSLMSSLVKEREATPEVTSRPEEIVSEPIGTESSKSDHPQVMESPPEQDVDDPPLILPLETEVSPHMEEHLLPPNLEALVEVDPPVMEPLIPTIIADESEEAEQFIVSDETLRRISEEKSGDNKPSTVLSQMKAIITEAERETEKQLAAFKEQLEPVSPSIPDVKPEPEPVDQLETKTQPITEDQPAPVQQSDVIDSSTPAGDPYMQLLTLEAEKYRLEKDIEKNEADFQEGLKSKQEFDETIQLINKTLSYIRKQIDALREQLTS